MELKSVDSFSDILTYTSNISQFNSGDDYIKNLIENTAKSLGIKYLMVGKPKVSNNKVILTEFVWGNTDFEENFEYPLAGTPCENVLNGRRVCIHPSNVAEEFPEDPMLVELGVESYVGAPILTPSGELLGLFAMLDDEPFQNIKQIAALTDFFASRIGIEYARLQADEKLKNINKELEEKIKEKTELIRLSHEMLLEQNKLASLGRVIAGIAHEIRNPLSFIMNAQPMITDSIDAIDKKIQSHPDISDDFKSEISKKISLSKNGLKLTEKHSLRIRDIMKKMLDQTKKGDLEREPWHLAKIINDSFQFAYHASSFQSSGIEFNFTNNVPEQTVVYFSRDIQSLFINIFENALHSLESKFSKTRELGLLTVDLSETDKTIKISIYDNGNGAPDHVVKHLFEPFFTTKETSNGTGLGLSLVKNIVAKNSGRISAKSHFGEDMQIIIEFDKEEILND